MDCYDSLMKQLSSDIERVVDAEADVAASAKRVLAELQTSRTNELSAETALTCKRNAESMLNTMIMFSGAASGKERPETGRSASNASQTKSLTRGRNDESSLLSVTGAESAPAKIASIVDYVS